MTRPLIINGNVATIVLTQGYRAVIDVADAPLVCGNNWSALASPRRNAVYAARVKQADGKQKMILLHRYLMQAPDGVQVDHKDGDGLNCRRANMRLCTHADNQINKGVRPDNKSGFKGVCWDKKAERWKAEICFRGKKSFLGYFPTPEMAHAAYRAAAVDAHGQFSREA